MYICDIKAASWTFFYAGLIKTSFRSQSLRIIVGHQPAVLLPLSWKFEPFKTARFSTSRSAPVLYLAPAMRLSDSTPADVSLLISHGPGYDDYSELNEKFMFKPESAILSQPLNCYRVPYRGFAQSLVKSPLLDRSLDILKYTDNQDTYDGLFRALCNAISISSAPVWPTVLGAVKRGQLRMRSDLFVDGLTAILSAPTSVHRDYFLSIVQDAELWNIFDSSLLASAIFQCFSGLDWPAFVDTHYFFVRVALNHPTDVRTIGLVLRHSRRLPRSARLLIALLKCDGITDWPSSLARTATPLQFSIVQSLVQLTDAHTVGAVTSLVSTTS
jgi:hypothetical protein